MPTNEEIKDLIDNFPAYPDVDALIANGDLVRVRGGYNVLTEVGMAAISAYLIGMSEGANGKPAVFQLSQPRKSVKIAGK